MVRLKKSVALFGAAILLVTCLMLYLSIEIAQLPLGIDGFKSDVKKNEISDLEKRLYRLENDLKKNHKTINEIMATVKDLLKPEKQIQWKKVYDQLQKFSLNNFNQSECINAAQVSEPVDIQMLDLYDTLPFDNIDGGVWKQGWPIEYDSNQWNSENKLKIFVVPHSHNDPGWIKTFEKYYNDQTQHILNNMVKKLSVDPRRRFIWAEISFLSHWWNKVSSSVRAVTKKLLQDGQLEIVTGGWVMNDEANTHYFAILTQLIEGHEWMMNHLGIKPKNGWAIDPFGMSPTMAYLLKRMNFSNMVIQRVHYTIKKYFAKHQSLEFLWRQTWDMNSSTDMFCHMMPFYSYDIPHTCGPDPKICCQFDFKRLPGSKINCPWRVPPQPITNKNVEERAMLLLDQYRKKSQLFKTNTLLVPLGDDFRYDKLQEWDQQFKNYQLLFDYMNGREDWFVQAQFGTLQDYFHALTEEIKFAPNKNFLSVSGDFFTYADREDHYWSGYYTSRPFYKQMDRVLEAYLRAGEILFSNVMTATTYSSQYNSGVTNHLMKLLVEARRNLGLFQHHDAITGTAKDAVVIDYANRLLTSIQGMQKLIALSAQYILDGRFADLESVPLFQMIDKRTSHSTIPENIIFNISQDVHRTIILYNSLGQKRQELVHIYVSTPYVCITDINGNIIQNQVNPVWHGDHIAPNNFQISFLAEIPALGFITYQITSVPKTDIANCNIRVPSISVFNSEWEFQTMDPFNNINDGPPSEFVLTNMNIEAVFHPNGLLKAIKLKNDGIILNTDLQFLKYGVRNTKEKSGAYLFLPDKEAQPIIADNPVVRIIKGPLLSKVQVFLSNVLHEVHIINSPGADGLGIDINNIVDITADVNKELIMRIITDITPNEHEFYTDLNGFQILKRKTFSKLPLQANYYPMPTLAFIEDNETRFTILTAQALGVASTEPGTLEVMLDRRLNQDDNRGLEQGVTDNKRTPNKFRFVVEKRAVSLSTSQSNNPNGFASLVSHVALQSILHPVFVLMSDESFKNVELKQKEYSPVLKDLPCDLHIVNLRTSVIETDNSAIFPTNMAALFLQRFGYDCGIIHPGFRCTPYNGKLSIDDIFPHLFNKEVLKMSLSLLHQEEVISKSENLNLKPMEIYAFRLTR